MKYFSALSTPVVESDKGIIRAASLISMGDAKGHFDDKGRQVIVDEVTLDQIFKECKKLGTIKVKADHGSGVFEIVGWADNFCMTENKVLADIHLYESEPRRPRLLEIAATNPTHMGISMEFTGTDKARGTVCLSRCNEVVAAAIVDDPAANSSLFSAIPPEPEPNETMEPETTPDETPDKYEELSKKFDDLTSKFEEMSKRFDIPDPDTDAPEKPELIATDKKDEPAENPDAGGLGLANHHV
jgi:hypothetical protein